MAEDPGVLDKARALIEDRLKELDDETKAPREGAQQPEGESSRARPSARLTLDPQHRHRHQRAQAAPPARRHPGRPRPQGGQGTARASPRRRSPTKLKIKPNYVYRVMAGLVEDGKVTKKGRGYAAT